MLREGVNLFKLPYIMEHLEREKERESIEGKVGRRKDVFNLTGAGNLECDDSA